MYINASVYIVTLNFPESIFLIELFALFGMANPFSFFRAVSYI